MKRWYVICCHARAEAKAEANLNQQGFETYLPCYLKRRRHARKTDWVNAPLFPGYLFVAVDVEAMRWRAIRSTIGVRHLVGHGEMPEPIDHSVIEAIKAREGDGGSIRISHQREWSKGQKVRVAVGPFADVEGLFECIDDKERVVVLLSLMGREIRTRLPEEALLATA